MLRITKQTDYGIMLVAHLASLPAGRIVSARDAADGTGLPVPMVSKILKSLARGAIVESHRGAGGGYCLTHAPHQTSLASVIRALEGPISMVECGAQPGQCDHEPNCTVRVNWSRVNRAVERALDSVPITEMVTPQPCGLLSLPGADDREVNRGAR